MEPPSWPKVTSFGWRRQQATHPPVGHCAAKAPATGKAGPEHDECLLMVDQNPIPSVMIFFLLTLAGLFSFSP